MAAGHPHRRLHHFGSHRGLGKIRNPNDQASPALHAHQRGCRAPMISLRCLPANSCQLIQNGTNMCVTACRRNAFLNASAIRQQSSAIATECRHLCEVQCCVDGEVQLGQSPNSGTHEPPAVDYDPNRLILFGSMHAGYVFAATSGCGPADVAKLVAIAELPQVFELLTLSVLSKQPPFQFDPPAAQQKYLMSFGRLQAWINTHTLR